MTAFLGLACLTSVARADDAALARDLSKQGYELFLANRCDEAIPILQESAKLAADPRTLVNLARCEEKVARLGAALEHLTAARDLARERQSTEMVRSLDTMIEELEQRIPRVKVSIDPSAPAGTTVKRGDVEVPASALASGVALDPGPQKLTATAPGFEPKTFEVTLAEGETKTLVVAPGAAIPPAPPASPIVSARSGATSRSPLETAGVIGMIAGGAALAVGGIFGAIALGKKGDAEDQGCAGAVCPSADAAHTRDDARSAGTVSTIAFIGGGVLAAAGLGLFLFAPSVSSDRVGFTMTGRF